MFRRLSGLVAALLALSFVAVPEVEARSKHSRAHGHSHHRTMKQRFTSMRKGAKSYIRSSRKHHGRRVAHTRYRPHQEVGALVLTENGETVLDQLSAMEMNPASVVKVITAYGALTKFGSEHRFNTDLYMDGELDKETGILKGDLYLKGCDPDFEKPDAEALAHGIVEAGVKQIDGKLIVDPNFSYRSDPNATRSAKSLIKIWHSKKCADRLTIKKGVGVATVPAEAESIGQFESETLRETLKRVMSFSLNRVAEQIGHTVGGVHALEDIVTSQAGLTPGSLKLASASGLGRSRVKPRDMMLILKGLRSKLQTSGLDYPDIFPVAGVDPGTLDERFTAPHERGSVVAKTGTLPGTDGGTSALCGMVRCQKEDLYFVIFCWKGSVVGFRHQQDNLLRQLQAQRGGPKAFDYRRTPQDNEIQLN